MASARHVGAWVLAAAGVSLVSFGCGAILGIKDVPSPGDGGADGTTGAEGGGPDAAVPDGAHPKKDGGGGKDGAAPDTTPGPDGPAPDAGTDSGASVVEYHLHPSRDGHYVDPLVTTAYAASLTRDTTFDGTIAGPLWGQPLYVENGVGGKGTFYVADDGNDVYAIDETTGKSVWSKTPLLVPAGTGQCPGNIQPLGVTSAPYIDLSSRTMYLAAATGNASGIKTYEIHALSIDTGAEVSGWPIDVSSITSPGGVKFNGGPQNQRGGLSLLNGYLYVAFGGQDGDCGNYHGWVVSVPVASPKSATGFATVAQGGGMWAVTGMASDGVDLFTVSGNATSGSGSKWAQFQSEAILRFHDGTAFDSTKTTDFFTPSNWQSLDGSDADLVGAGPLVLDVPGATPSALVAAFGKSGVLHLLDRGNLGGIGKGDGTKNEGLYSDQIGSGNLRGAAASYATGGNTYIVVHTEGGGTSCPGGGGDLVAVKVAATAPPTFTTVWCANTGGSGSPIVTTTDAAGANPIVWVASAEGSNQLLGYNGVTGKSVFGGGGFSMDNVIHWTTPIEVKGRIIVGSNDKLYAFKGK